ncbi:MAG TPA: type II toxin-antitoxin system RelE/ParE family toxin, partial [Candidatus Scatosoma pullistercoris]|nr:type II toxin-antitoxin system RelE/ParE family toxin [Candidatus Scatosoma pullistercoris]
METYEIEVLEKADEDVRRLGRYIAVDLKNPSAAERMTEKIWDEVERLSKNPY